MTFALAHYSWLLALLPIAVALCILRARRRAKYFNRLGTDELLVQIYPGYKSEKANSLFYAFYICLATFFLVLALLRPQWGFTWQEIPRSGIDVAVAIDVSESMLAEDIKPNRLKRAQREIIDFLSSVQGDRLALVAFSGIAFIEVPLTLDYDAFALFLSDLTPELIPLQGTNIEDALSESLTVLGVSEKVEKKSARSKAILLITDGENFQGDYTNIAETARTAGVKIFILGIGTQEGSPIPDNNGLKKDKASKIVISKLNESALVDLAQKTGGLYVRSISSDKDTKAIYQQGIKQLIKKNDQIGQREKRMHERFQVPLLLALICLILGPWLGIRKYLIKNKELILLLLSCLTYSEKLAAQPLENLGASAKEKYDQSKYADALELFTKGKQKAFDDYRFSLGRGSSYYRLGDFTRAKAAFAAASSRTVDPLKKAESLYNAANSMAQLEEYEEAIKTYEESLKLNPKDLQAQENLKYVKKKEKEKKQDKKKDKQNQDKDKDKKDKEDKKDKQNQQDQDKKDEDKKEQEKKKQEQDKNKEKDHDQEKPEDDAGQEKKPTEGKEKEEQTSSSPESILNNIQEQKRELRNFRMEKAQEKAKKYKPEEFENDW